VGTMAVVVLDVAVEDAKKLPAPGDQEMVQTLLAHGANPALGDGVGVRSLDRCADDLGAEPVPDVVEGVGYGNQGVACELEVRSSLGFGA